MPSSFRLPREAAASRRAEILERAGRKVKHLSKEEKLASKYCSVGEHPAEDALYYCMHCKRTFCEEHGDEKHGLCNEDIVKGAGQV